MGLLIKTYVSIGYMHSAHKYAVEWIALNFWLKIPRKFFGCEIVTSRFIWEMTDYVWAIVIVSNKL